MICNSCCKVVKWELERTGFIQVQHVELGRADILYNESIINLEMIDLILRRNDFELIENKEQRLVEQIKQSVIQLVFYGANTNTILRNSDYLSQKLGEPYNKLSKIFHQHTGITLEKFIIQIKIEKVKELMSYESLTLSEIAYQLGYSSVAHLSGQFKQIEGVNVQDYKKKGVKTRKSL